jgi:hypothetical protein
MQETDNYIDLEITRTHVPVSYSIYPYYKNYWHLYNFKNEKHRAGGMAQVVEYLHCKREVLSSNTSIAKKMKAIKAI